MTDPFLLPLAIPSLSSLVEAIQTEGRSPHLGGISGSAASLILFLIGRKTGRSMLILCPEDPVADRLAADLRSFQRMIPAPPGGGEEIVSFPTLGADPYQGLPPHPQVGWERVDFLLRVGSGNRRSERRGIYLCSGPSLLQPLVRPGDLEKIILRVREWQEISPDRFQETLDAAGYTRVDLVTQRGEWSRRGGILDVHPAASADPVRIEMYGDQVESIRTFDPCTQRSITRINSFEIPPFREFPLTRENLDRLIPVLERADRQSRESGVESRAEALRNRGYFMGVEALAGLVYEEKFSLFDWLDPKTMVVAVEPGELKEKVVKAWTGLESRVQEEEDPALPPPERLYQTPDEILPRLEGVRMTFEELADPEEKDPFRVLQRSHLPIPGRMPDLLKRIRESAREGWWQLLLLDTPGRISRIKEILGEENIPVGEVVGGGKGGIQIREGSLHNGFEFPEARLLVYNEEEIFGSVHRPAAASKGRATFHSDFRDLRNGDLVVHAEHGIGRFLGLEMLAGNGQGEGEFLVLEYRDGDRLFVPIVRLDLLQRYSGSGGSVPRLDRLGGKSWEKTRTKVKGAMREMAGELLKLYAARKADKGHAFAPDTPWQKELEDAFPFEETPDQERTIMEVKRDMEREEPMDRLLCGDVGFGKTEVALRSAFKAVMDGRQVAVLVPTTVLAFQHDRTFKERFAPFPVRVGMLSRFRSRQEQRETLAELETGKIDIIIGTHRLLSRDVRFRNLGLLIIDEEQRFGVKQKERIQAMRHNVDVLAMTATPIPRTLQMSLAGIRDLSVIETPPRDRLEIQTSVVPFREGVLTAAIRNELSRGGQIYFVHNRIESIASMADLIRRICPEASIGIAHGQMRENQLEKTMLSFVEGAFDILLSTTIIENGLDIPNVNTLIVNRADRFGLAQLYQLRGRVGRSRQKAYAYLLVPSYRVLSETARKRLRVLQDFTQLGSGFRIAAMDLEIRGAGNVLGGQQHGHIAAVGFDTYVKLLENAVRELRGEEIVPDVRPEINLRLDYTLPEDYIPEMHQRLFLYKKISSAGGPEELEEIRNETEDGYGRLPPTGVLLFEMAGLRLQAAKIPIQAMEWSGGFLRIRFGELESGIRERVIGSISEHPEWRLTPGGSLLIPAAGKGNDRIIQARAALMGLI